MAVHSRYLDIAKAIKERIKAGEWQVGDRLPPLRELGKEFGANRDTVGRAVGALEAEGYVVAVQGSGVTVRAIPPTDPLRPMRQRGDKVKRNTKSTGYSFPSASSQEKWERHGDATSAPEPLNDPRIANLLGVEPGTEVLRRFRVTGPPAEAPFQINSSWIHPRVADLVADVDANPAAGEWLYRIERAGHWPIAWVEFHRVRMPTKEEMALLGIPASLPVWEIVRQGRSGADSQPVEVTEYVIPGDRVETFHILQREGGAQEPWPEDGPDTEDGP